MKVKAVMLTLLFILSMVPAGFAADYRQQAAEFLAGELDVALEKIEIVDGGLMDLPLTGEQFWAGKYFSDGIEGTTPSRDPDGSHDSPDRPDITGDAGAENNPPEKNRPGSSGPETGSGDDPVSSDPSGGFMLDGFGPTGYIYIRIKTGEFMTYAGAEPFFIAERELQEKEWEREREEWERLSREAGKIVVPLYQKILDASPGQRFDVYIQAIFVETEEIRKEAEKVYGDYPEFQQGLRGAPEPRFLPVDDDKYSGEDSILLLPEPDLAPDGVSSPSYGGGDGGSGDDLDLVVPEPEPADDFDHELYQEMCERLQEIWLRGYAESLALIKEQLNSMGVEYQELPHGVVQCSLTADQLLSLRNLDFIGSIYDEMSFRELDDAFAMAELLDAFPPFEEADGRRDGGNNLWVFLVIFPALIGGAAVWMLIRRRKGNPHIA